MAVDPDPTFPLALDLIPRINEELDHAGAIQKTWEDSEFARKLQDSTRGILSKIINKDRNYQLTRTTLTLAATDTEVSMPARAVAIVRMVELGGDGNAVRTIYAGTPIERWHGGGLTWNRSARTLERTNPRDTSAYSIELSYIWKPTPIAHGLIVDAGAGYVQFQQYELGVADAYVDLPLYAFDPDNEVYYGPVTVTDFDPGPREAEITPSFQDTSGTIVTAQAGWYYTSRPPLPWNAVDALVYDTAYRLVGKVRSAAQKLKNDRDEAMQELLRSVVLANRQTGERVRIPGGHDHGDPIASYLAGGGPGLWGNR